MTLESELCPMLILISSIKKKKGRKKEKKRKKNTTDHYVKLHVKDECFYKSTIVQCLETWTLESKKIELEF